MPDVTSFETTSLTLCFNYSSIIVMHDTYGARVQECSRIRIIKLPHISTAIAILDIPCTEQDWKVVC